MAFSFVPFVLSFRVIYFVIKVHRGYIHVKDSSGTEIKDTTYGYKELVLVISCMLARIIMMSTMFRMKDQSRRIVKEGKYILPPIAALYVLNLLMNIYSHHFMTIVSMVVTVDAIMFVFQCVYYALFYHM